MDMLSSLLLIKTYGIKSAKVQLCFTIQSKRLFKRYPRLEHCVPLCVDVFVLQKTDIKIYMINVVTSSLVTAKCTGL